MEHLSYTLKIERLRRGARPPTEMSFDDVAPTTLRSFRATIQPAQAGRGWTLQDIELAKKVSRKTVRLLIEAQFTSAEIAGMTFTIGPLSVREEGHEDLSRS